MLNAFSQQVQNFIRRHNLLRGGEHVLVAVSGGADSVALLHVLKELARPLKLRLTVAHLNHKIRGKDAGEDARFVRQLARRLRLDFALGTAAVPRIARRSGISLEMAGRRARYMFFEKTALARGCDVVTTAHTANDNAETILLMLVRGCGLQGLTGIAPKGRIGKMTVVRPFLGTDRKAIEQYLRERKTAWREDLSNADPSFLRNRVRHELLPLLEAKYNKGIKETLNRMSVLLREENDFIERIAEKAYCDSLTNKDFNVFVRPLLATRRLGPDGLWRAEALHESAAAEKRRKSCRSPALNTNNLAKYHRALRRRVLRRWLLENGIDSAIVDFRLINSIDHLIMCPESGKKISLAGGLTVRRRDEYLAIEKDVRDAYLAKPIRRGADAAALPVKINIPGRTVLTRTGLQVTAKIGPGVQRERAIFGKFPARASISLQAWRRRRIWARVWRPGDRMRPYGLNGSKKVQDIFSDAKVPAALRHRLPIFECGGEIIWLPGYRIAKGWEVPPSDRTALHLTVEPV